MAEAQGNRPPAAPQSAPGRLELTSTASPGDDSTGFTAPEAGLPSLGRGSQLAGFVIMDRIGAGAVGVIYAAYDPDLDRRVALKLLRAAEDGRDPDAERHARLLREAKAMARLDHPNVITVYDAGIVVDGHAAGHAFVAMELVDGGSMADWLAAAPRGYHEVWSVMRQAGEALVAAHAAGLVHRDFKPENILVGHDGSVRVTDFGMVAALPEAPDSARRADSAWAPDSARTADSAWAPDSARTADSAWPPDAVRPPEVAGSPGAGRDLAFEPTVSIDPLPPRAPGPTHAAAGSGAPWPEALPLRPVRQPDTDDGFPLVAEPPRRSRRGTVPFVSLTRSGAVMGTPAYMAPEQHLAKPCDDRVDQFAFCVTLYRALYGFHPFAGDDYPALRAAVLLGAVAPEPPQCSAPPHVRRAIRRGLEVDPHHRFPAMRDLLAAIEAPPCAPTQVAAEALLALAATQEHGGHTADAGRLYREAAIAARSGGSDDAEIDAWLGLARLSAAAGQTTDATAWARMAEAILDRRGETSSPRRHLITRLTQL